MPRSAMFSRLTHGVSSVLQELSGEERSDGDFQDGRPQPDAEASLQGSETSEEVLERLAQTEQLVVQLKELIREKDSQLARTEKHLKEEKEQAEVKFTKLKLQAKAKTAALNKQLNELKGQEALYSSQSSFQMAPEVEEELQQLKEKLSQAESANKTLQHQLWEAEQRVREEGHAEQVRILQAVVREKDVRFEEQIFKHEQELLNLTQVSNDLDLQQALRASQQRIEELEESLRSRSEVLEMLQQELNSADQQKQILTAQFRQMELELAEARRLREEERQQWAMQAEKDLQALRATLEASGSEREQTVNSLNTELLKKTTEMDEMRAKLESAEREKEETLQKLKDKEDAFEAELTKMKTTEMDEMREKLESAERQKEETLEKLKDKENAFEAELAKMKVCLEARLETSESEREQTISTLNINVTQLNAELLKKTTELDEMRTKLESSEREKDEMLEKMKERETNFETELTNLKVSLETRLETLENERDQNISAHNAELLKKTAEVDEIREKLESGQREKEEMLVKIKERECAFEADLTKMKGSLETRLETLENESNQNISALNAELLKKTTEMDEMRAKLESAEREKEETLEKLKERETSFEAELTNLKVSLEARLETTESEKEQTISALNSELLKKATEMDEMRAKLESAERLKEEMLEKLKDKENAFEAELTNLKVSLEARLETTESEKEQTISTLNISVTQLNAELLKKTTELDEMRAKLESGEREKEEMLEKMKERETSFETELTNLKISLETRLETTESEKEQTISTLNISVTQLNAELLKKTTELDEMRAKLESREREKEEMLEKMKERETNFEAELTNLKISLETRLETLENERDQNISALNAELLKKTAVVDEIREKLESEEREKNEMLEKFKERETSFEAELTNLKVSLETRLETSENERDQNISALNSELLRKTAELDEIRAKLESGQREKEEMLETMKKRESTFETELTNLKISLEARLETTESEKEQTISALNAELLKKTSELVELREKLSAEERESLETLQERQITFETKLTNLQACLEVAESQKEQMTKKLEVEVASRMEERHHLQEKLNEVERAREEESKSERDRLAQMQNELESLRETLDANKEEQKAGLQAKDALEKLWRGIQNLTTPGEAAMEISIPTDPAQFLEVLPCLEARLSNLTDEHQESQACMSQITLTLQSLQGQLDKSTAEREEAVARIQELEHQRLTVQVTGESLRDHGTDLSVRDLDRTHQVENMPFTVVVCQQEGSLLNTDSSTGQAFAQILAEEIQKRQNVAEQFENLQEEALSKDDKMKALQASLDEVHQRLVEQQGQARMLAVQLEDRELTSSELEQKLVDMEGRLVQVSQEADMAKAALIARTAELEGLQKCLSQKDQEMMELNESMTAKLLQAGEERFTVSSEVKKLKEQIHELESVRDDQQKIIEDKTAECEELVALRTENDDLNIQMAALKKNGEQIASMESDIEILHKKLQEATDAHEDAVVKAQEKARHHLEQMKQQKEEYSDLFERLQTEEREKTGLLNRIVELEGLLESKNDTDKVEDWVDFTPAETTTQQHKPELEERQIDALTEEMEALREKCQRAEANAVKLRAEVDEAWEAAKRSISDAESPIKALQSEMQETVLEKDQQIASLQEGLKAEQDKEALKEKQVLKEEQTAAEKIKLELQQKLELIEVELNKSREEREKLIEEAESAKEESEQVCRQLEEKVQSMKEEYESLLKSYENELAGKARAHEAARQEAERLAEEAMKEVDVVKEKMRKFAKKSLEHEAEELRQRLAEDIDKKGSENLDTCSMETIKESDSIPPDANPTKPLESIAENKIRELEAALEDHMESRNKQESTLNAELASLKQQLQDLETERDDLEERLMNQLAQLNGSIAGYQQEASDSRDRLTDMQRELEKLERERAELEAEVASERDRAARMEEDMRQAQRERAEAEGEAGKQRELEQKLKSAQRFKEGNQNRTRQLEELLREKQMEVRQLQKDCIEYQERISELGKLDMALEEAKQAQAEKIAAEQMVQRREAELKADAERTLDEVRYRLGAELKQMELRLEKSYREREREEEATLEARSIAEATDRHAQEMQARLDEALARLAAFSRSMSSLQDDRDRVLDEAKQWESRFHRELQEKEADVRQAETRAKELTERLQRETTQKEELQSLLERMQKVEENLQLELSEAEKKHNESFAALEKERGDLQQNLALVETNLTQTRSQLTTLETEAEGLRHRTKALEEAVDKLQSDANEARAVIKERETEERRLCLRLEQLETDLASSKNLTDNLQAALDEKEKREMELLGEKEQAVTQAVEEARKDADGRAEMAEKELEKKREELRSLEERLRKAEEDTFQSRAQLESFTKAMGSLQDDRDRVLSQYKQLEERHLQVMMDKDSLIQEAAGENNGLKEEIRALLSQRDDLNAENAKLAAQLHGYRNDLNQVLAMKDSQHKQILATQVERISFLEREKENLESQIQALVKDVAQGKVPPLEQEILSQASEGIVRADKQDAPGAEVEKLREQLQAARKRITTLEETLELEKETQAVHSKELKELRWEGGVLRTEAETAEERVAELARDLLMMEQQLLEEREAASQLRAQNQSFGQAMASLQDARDQAVNETKELRLRLDEINQTGHPASPPSGSKGELEQLHLQRSELDRLGSGELSRLTQALEDERRRAGEQEEKIMAEMRHRDAQMDRYKQELEMLRLERMDWQGQAELLKQQTLTTLSERDQQVRHLTAMLEEARTSKLRLEHTQRQGSLAVDAAPGGPLEHNEGYKAECIELQRRLDEESEQRLRVEEQLIAAQDRLKCYTQGEWQTASEAMMSETAVLIEPPEGAVTRTRSGGPGLLRMLRVAFCSRQRTPLLVSLYLLTVHVLLLLCMGGYLLYIRKYNMSHAIFARLFLQMWKSVVGHDVNVKVESEGDDWETDPNFENDVSEQEQRWGSRTIEGSGRKEHISIADLRQKVSREHEVVKKKELDQGPKASYGYGGKFGVEKDRMDKGALGHSYVAEVEKHSSQTDAAKGFGGKFGVQKDRVDKSAMNYEYKGEVQQHASQKDYAKGFGGKYGVQKERVDKAAVGYDYKGETEKHQSQKDYAKGFGGKYGVEKEKVDKAAVGYDYKGETEKHQSQKDYAKGFGGKYGVEKEKVDKAALGYDYKGETEKHQSQKDYAKGFGGRYGVEADRMDKSAASFNDMESPSSSYEKPQAFEASSVGAGNLKARFENMAKASDEENRKKAEEERVRRLAREKREREEAQCKQEVHVEEEPEYEEPPLLPPRSADLIEEKEEEEEEQTYAECEPAPVPQEEDYEDISSFATAAADNDYEDLCVAGQTATAIYDYQGEASDEISFMPGDIITNVEMVDEGWWKGTCHGRTGLFPATFVELQ
ncbi:hypothetical protein cypCar_00038667 [Cyprinus carpio]|nr:hypothetical protein cypCar_00038667 [Cyprinus carpio]